MLAGYPVQDVVLAVGIVVAFSLGFIAGNQR